MTLLTVSTDLCAICGKADLPMVRQIIKGNVVRLCIRCNSRLKEIGLLAP